MRFKIALIFFILILLPRAVYAEALPGDGRLWLVNKNSRLDGNYVPAGMEKCEGFFVHPAVADPYKQMLAAMKEDGLDGLYIQSGYRDYGHQRYLFDNKKAWYINQGYDDETAGIYASRSVTYPGASEHQTGLALDVTTDGHLRQSFGETEHGQWINANCARFGFIVRYPEEKTEITQIIYEPWHLRYVGVPHAAFMKEKNLCLEEYMDYLAENEKYIFWIDDKTSYYLVEYLEEPPEASPEYETNVSADKPGGTVRYIKTTLKKLQL